jgi:RimJ/RimL family protein N-acetyltransferase
MKDLLKAAARALLGEYAAYHVLSRDNEGAPAPAAGGDYRVVAVDRAAIEASGDPLMREQAGYAGEGAFAYACMHGEQIVGLCFYWHGARYLKRNFWPLKEGEAKLVQIITSPRMRGKRVAGTLITASSADMFQRGFHKVYARVWHSNEPSLRAFAGARWTRCATVVEVNPLRRSQPMRLRFIR